MTLDEAIALKRASHAVSIAETYDCVGRLEYRTITHYSTCYVCNLATMVPLPLSPDTLKR
jgi:hypothetical protein